MANQTPEHFIAFDFGGVLGSGFSHENAFEFYQNRLPDMNWDGVNDVASLCWDKYKIGACTEVEYWQEILDAMKANYKNQTLPFDLTVNDLIEFTQSNYKLYYQSLGIVERLRDRNYVLCILSNHTKEWFPSMFARMKLSNLFANPVLVVLSCDDDVKCAKPDPKIYASLLTRIQTQYKDATAAQIIMIDDKQRNVTAAEKCGMRGICFNAAKHKPSVLINALKEMGVDATEQ